MSSLKWISSMQLWKGTTSIPQEDLDRAVRYTTHALLRAAQRLVLVQVPRLWQEDVFLDAEWCLSLLYLPQLTSRLCVEAEARCAYATKLLI